MTPSSVLFQSGGALAPNCFPHFLRYHAVLCTSTVSRGVVWCGAWIAVLATLQFIVGAPVLSCPVLSCFVFFSSFLLSRHSRLRFRRFPLSLLLLLLLLLLLNCFAAAMLARASRD